jgi:nicotinate-nucleotide pyrophosphorylase (carboxylating)
MLQAQEVDSVIGLALDEDTGRGDVTTAALVPKELQGRACVMVKAPGVLAGGEIARIVFLKVDPSLQVELLTKDGSAVQSGDLIACVAGNVVSMLKAERVALNFLQRLSGIASRTAQYVAAVHGLPVVITDTRKTTPGLRLLEKYAVRMGGGRNHRFSLGDGILIKDNHLAALRALGMSMKEIVAKAKKNAPQGFKVEVEVTGIQEALDAVEAGADTILLDNMGPEEMLRVAGLVKGRVRTEASGGITLDTVRAVAMSGVDQISVGALTHSVNALDMSLELEAQTLRLL